MGKLFMVLTLNHEAFNAGTFNYWSKLCSRHKFRQDFDNFCEHNILLNYLLGLQSYSKMVDIFQLAI